MWNIENEAEWGNVWKSGGQKQNNGMEEKERRKKGIK